MSENSMFLAKRTEIYELPPSTLLEILTITAEVIVAACMASALLGMPILLVLWEIGF